MEMSARHPNPAFERARKQLNALGYFVFDRVSPTNLHEGTLLDTHEVLVVSREDHDAAIAGFNDRMRQDWIAADRSYMRTGWGFVQRPPKAISLPEDILFGHVDVVTHVDPVAALQIAVKACFELPGEQAT